MTMNNEAHSAYPGEAEVLLCDGCDMIVLGVDSCFKIGNKGKGEMSRFNGKSVTIVHMFHTGEFNET